MYDNSLRPGYHYLNEDEMVESLQIAENAERHKENCSGNDGECIEEQSLIAKGLRYAVSQSRSEVMIDTYVGSMVGALLEDPEVDGYERFLLTKIVERAKGEMSERKRYTSQLALHDDFRLGTHISRGHIESK